MPPAGSAPLLLLTGSPGTGKTTVAPLVADRHERSACLDLDWFFATIRSGAVEPWREEAHGQNRVVLHAGAEAASALAAGGYLTVGAGILYPFMLDLFTTACARRGVDVHYAVLHAPLALVQHRVSARKVEPMHAQALDDPAVVGDLWTQFESLDVAARHRVEVGQHSPAEVAEEIDRRLGAGEFRL